MLRPRIFFVAGLVLAVTALGLITPPGADAQFGRKIAYDPSASTLSTEPETQLTDEQLLRSAGLSPDGSAVVDFFKTRTQVSADREKIAGFIEQLGSKKVEDREKAIGGLVSHGPLAVSHLRQAMRDPDNPQVAALPRKCLELIEGNGTNSPSLPAAAARVSGAEEGPRIGRGAAWTTFRSPMTIA